MGRNILMALVSSPRRLSVLVLLWGLAPVIFRPESAVSAPVGTPREPKPRPPDTHKRLVRDIPPEGRLGAGTGSPQTKPLRGGDCAQFVLTQNLDTATIEPNNTLQCATVLQPEQIICFTAENGLARSYDLAVGPTAGRELIVRCVDFGIETNRGGDPTCDGRPASPFRVVINLYIDTDAGSPWGPNLDLNLVGTTAVIVPAGAVREPFRADFQNGVGLPADVVLVVETYLADRDPVVGGDGGVCFIGSNQVGETAPSYLRASACDLPVFTPLSELDAPNAHLLQRVHLDDVRPPATGACCTASGCVTATRSACAFTFGGLFQGDGTTCSANPCPSCLTCGGDLDGSGIVDMLDVAPFVAALLGEGGSPCADVDGDGQVNGLDVVRFLRYVLANQGQGAPCDDLPVEGACCLPDGACQSGSTIETCAAAGGVYQGDGAQCASNPCAGPDAVGIVSCGQVIGGCEVTPGVPRYCHFRALDVVVPGGVAQCVPDMIAAQSSLCVWCPEEGGVCGVSGERVSFRWWNALGAGRHCFFVGELQSDLCMDCAELPAARFRRSP